MIYILSTSLINLCLIFAVWRLNKRSCCFDRALVNNEIFWFQIDRLEKLFDKKFNNKLKKYLGIKESYYRKVAIAEKMADRAFNMASTANLGVVALQKALVVPRIMTKQQVAQNHLAKNGVDKLFTQNGSFDWLRPILSDEENDLLDEAEKLKNSAMEHKE